MCPPPPRDRLHLVLGFTAGVLLGLVAFELVPETFELAGGATVLGVPVPMVSLAVGFLALHVLERSVVLHGAHEDEYGQHRHPRVGQVAAAALTMHSFLDGVGIGLAFQVSAPIGFTVAFAVIAHDFADGLNTVAVLLAHGNSVRAARFMLALDALAPVLGAGSTLFFTLADQLLATYLGFFAGFLLYLATGDILPEAHARHPSRLTLVCTVTGVALILAVVSLS